MLARRQCPRQDQGTLVTADCSTWGQGKASAATLSEEETGTPSRALRNPVPGERCVPINLLRGKSSPVSSLLCLLSGLAYLLERHRERARAGGRGAARADSALMLGKRLRFPPGSPWQRSASAAAGQRLLSDETGRSQPAEPLP